MTRQRPWDGGRGAAFRYERGLRLLALFTGPSYRVDDWIGYGLRPPPAGTRWIRYFDDAVLIEEDGRVVDAAPGIDWAKPPALYGPTPRRLQRLDEGGRTTRTDGDTATEVRALPGGRIMVTTTTTPGVATTTVHRHEVP